MRTSTGPYQNYGWLSNSWEREDDRIGISKDPAMFVENMELRRANRKLKFEVERLQDIEKKYNVLKKLADRMKADSKRLLNVKMLRKALR